MSVMQIPVKYIGPDAYWEGMLYDVRLRFDAGQTRVLPEALALKFLTHKDTFERDDAFAVTPKSAEQETQDALDQTQKRKDDENAQHQELFEVRDQIDLMQKDQLADFAVRYGTRLDKRLGVERLRADVKQLIDHNGLI